LEPLRGLPVIPILAETPLDFMTMINGRFPEDSEPRSEPEILPPGKTDRRELEGRLRGRVSSDAYGFQRIYVSRIGPFGFLPLVLFGGLFTAALFVFVVSAFFILIPVAAFLLAGALFAGLLRGRSHWLR
jgi:hypothetical protein